MKRYIKPAIDNITVQLNHMMQLSGGGQNSFSTQTVQEGATGDVLGKEQTGGDLWED